MTHSLLIATGNPGKMREIKAILQPLNCKIVTLLDLGLTLDVKETGETYLENAQIKANAYHKVSDMITLADDSGLEVNALQGAPGIYSARFSPKQNANDADRREYLLEQLKNKPKPWTAHFHCTAVVALNDQTLINATGRIDGIIIPEERGSGGFGYDPIFYVPEYQATMAQLAPEIKNSISHRAKAISAMIPVLKDILS